MIRVIRLVVLCLLACSCTPIEVPPPPSPEPKPFPRTAITDRQKAIQEGIKTGTRRPGPSRIVFLREDPNGA